MPASDRRCPPPGPFFDVQDIRIEGLDDRPDLGLEIEDLKALAREELSRQADEQEIETQGYSDEELLEVARYLDRVKNRRNDSDFTKIALVDELIQLLEDFESRRGISVFDLEAVASAVQGRIRESGLILAQVVVPPQTVKEGEVTLRVYPGRLGGVRVVNNETSAPEPLVSAFDDVIDEPVEVTAVDERLRLVNDLQGLDVSGVFVPGRKPGETILELNTVNERRWSLVERIDNHGSSITGRTRGLIQGTLHDATGAGDSLTLSALRSEGPDEVTLATLNYYRPLPGLRYFLQGGISRNEFTVGGATDIRGDTRNYDLAFGNHWLRSRERNLNQTIHASYKDSELLLAGGITDRSQKIGEFGSTLTYDMLISGWRAILDGSTSIRFGTITEGRQEGSPDPAGGSFDGQDKDFVVASQTLRFYKLFDLPLPLVDHVSEHSVLIRMNGQFTEQFLPSVNRMSLGGADAVRSLLADDISVDKGAVATFQLYWQIPDALDFDLPLFDQRFSETLRPYVFYDYGYGVTKAARVDAATQDDTWFEFAGYGAGFEYNLQKNNRGGYAIHGSVGWAAPSKSRFGNPLFETIIEDEDRIYADLTIEIDQNDWPFFGGRR
ncbi:MAG: ShlB/FhaC/HecB family hemolysin secretion/activation protein [Gammaproteobacteria bacterium]|nr:ShlB/FhaC/HecB family hemolysin secretion/activation protein [Gammaproteobacteria bacterium]